jgi:hypothetical protein
LTHKEHNHPPNSSPKWSHHTWPFLLCTFIKSKLYSYLSVHLSCNQVSTMVVEMPHLQL